MQISAIILAAVPGFALANNFNFGGMFQDFFGGGGNQYQQQNNGGDNQKLNNLVENTYNTLDCAGYLCEDTLKCVETAQDCPCVFPDSQLKCEFPGRQGYVCISKPSNADGPDCDYVLESFK